MKLISLIYFLILLLNIRSVPNPTLKVIGIVEIFRHGARAPIAKYSDSKKLYFGSERSQLTINGFRQHVILGRWLRRRYLSGDIYKLFDDDSLKTNEITIYSSPTQRTIFSAAAHFLGFLPESKIKINFIGHPEIKTRDVPPIINFRLKKRSKEIIINVIEDGKDNLFKAKLCYKKGHEKPLIQEVIKKRMFDIRVTEFKLAIDEILKKYGDFYKYKEFDKELLNNKNKYSELTMKNLVDVLRQYKYHNDINFSDLNLNEDTLTTIKKNRLNYFYSHRLEETDSKKLYVSRMFQLITNFFNNKIHNRTYEKMLVFSGHDDNIASVLANLLDKQHLLDLIYNGIKDRKDYYFVVPPLASSILIELIEVIGSKKHYIRLIYNGDEITENFIKKVNYDDELGLLDFSDFIQLLESRILVDYKTLDCKIKRK